LRSTVVVNLLGINWNFFIFVSIPPVLLKFSFYSFWNYFHFFCSCFCNLFYFINFSVDIFSVKIRFRNSTDWIRNNFYFYLSIAKFFQVLKYLSNFIFYIFLKCFLYVIFDKVTANVMSLWDGWIVTAQFSILTKIWCGTIIPLNLASSKMAVGSSYLFYCKFILYILDILLYCMLKKKFPILVSVIFASVIMLYIQNYQHNGFMCH
jgi:hypothetical protein